MRLIKHLLGLDQWLLGCVRMCVTLSISIKARVTSKGDRVSRNCELSAGRGGGGHMGGLCECFSKACTG